MQHLATSCNRVFKRCNMLHATMLDDVACNNVAPSLCQQCYAGGGSKGGTCDSSNDSQHFEYLQDIQTNNQLADRIQGSQAKKDT